MLFIIIHGADIHGSDGAADLIKSIGIGFPWLRHNLADGGYAGGKLKDVLKAHGNRTIEIIKRSDKAEGFEVLSRRWVVERTLRKPGRF